jgi:hypothetical protein
VGDWVLLRHRPPASLHVPSGGKLKAMYYGPFHVLAIVNAIAYMLKLPTHARLHDLFHVGLLKKFHGAPL